MSTGVEALAEDPKVLDPIPAEAQAIGQLLGEYLLGLVELQADVGDFPGHWSFCGAGRGWPKVSFYRGGQSTI